MTKTISSRIYNRTHNDLLERCNRIGYNINEFVAESVKFMLTNESDFEFDLEDDIVDESPKPQVIIKELENPVTEITNAHVVEI